MNEQSKLCPYCKEEIKADALKCKHCGSMLTDTGAINSSDPITFVKLAVANKYEIVSEIGRGGMATVYKAIQKNLNRTIALKVIHQNLIHDQEFLERFHKEARIAASLNHQNIVTIHDEGVENGVHFIAMEYLEGIDLHSLIKTRGKLTPQETIRIIHHIARVLDFAHKKEIIHRDIKSANIIYTKEGRIVLTDFGIARAVSGTKSSLSGSVIGTPEYMSPEQAEGKLVDHRTDIYSLGVVMYECLGGKVPFKDDNPLTTIYKIINNPVPKLEVVDDQVPAWLHSILEKSLSKLPANRFQSGKEFAEALREKRSEKLEEVPDLKAGSKVTSGSTIKIKSEIPLSKVKKDKLNYFLGAGIIITTVIIVFLLFDKNSDTAEVNNASTKNDIPGNMVLVEGGTLNGVMIKSFYMDKYEVTVGEFKLYCSETNRPLPEPWNYSWSDDLPISNVNWYHAKEFAAWANKRLPTEEEWMWAAIGGLNSNISNNDDMNNILEVGWISSNSKNSVQKVGMKKPNKLGLYDMQGNLWEWTLSGKDNGTTLSPILKGGSWYNDEKYADITYKYFERADYKSSDIGFRCVKDIKSN